VYESISIFTHFGWFSSQTQSTQIRTRPERRIKSSNVDNKKLTELHGAWAKLGPLGRALDLCHVCRAWNSLQTCVLFRFSWESKSAFKSATCWAGSSGSCSHEKRIPDL